MKGLLYKEFLSLKKYLNALGLLLVLYFGISVYSREVSFFAGFSVSSSEALNPKHRHSMRLREGLRRPAKIWCRGGICLL